MKFTSNNWSQYDSVKVGLDPSAQSGIVEILNDPDKNGVFKVKQNLSQKFVVEYSKGESVERDVYDLSGLTLSEEPPTPPAPTDPGPISAPASGTFATDTTPASITGQNITMGTYTRQSMGGPQVDLYNGTTGTISDASGLVGLSYDREDQFSAGNYFRTTTYISASETVNTYGEVDENGKINFTVPVEAFAQSPMIIQVDLYEDSYRSEDVGTQRAYFMNSSITQS